MDRVTPLIAIARDGLDLGDAALAVDPGGRTLALIEGGANELDPALAGGMAEVILGLGTHPPGLLPDGFVVGDHRAWSLRTDRLLPEPLRKSA